MNRTLRAAIVAGAALLSACSGLQTASRTSASASFSSDWPSRPRPYKAVYADWTREARLIRDFDRLLEVTATYKSTEWRAAYVALRGVNERLPKQAIDDLARRELDDSNKFHEIELLVRTYRIEDNDLQKNLRSRWRVVLVDDQGNQYRATQIRRDRRTRGVLMTLFPDLHPQDDVYIAQFPRAPNLMAAKKFSLVIGSVEGSVELTWTAR